MEKTYILLLLTLFSVFAKAQTIVWDGKTDFVGIGDKILTLEDSSNSLTINDVRSEKFKNKFVKSEKDIINFGFSESIHWLKFSLENDAEEESLLEIAHAFLPITDLYYEGDDGKIIELKAGYKVPLYEKVIKHHFQIFPIPKGKHEFYVKVLTNAFPLAVSIIKKSAFEIKSTTQKLTYGFYVGFMFFVVLSNLFFFVSLRNPLYLFYVVVVCFYFCYSALVLDGYILYVFPKTDLMFWFITLPALGIPIQTAYALLFNDAKKYIPKINKIIWGLIIYFSIWALIEYFFTFKTIHSFNTVHSLISFFLMGFIGYKVGKKGNRLGYYFAFAYVFYFLLVLVQATYQETGTPSYLGGISHVTIATLIESFILSFLLSKRFEWEKEDIKKEKEDAQLEVLKLHENANKVLEAKVTERTSELNHLLENLKNTQNQLIQSEKLASLGELTAGIAHEIQNPLNFVNNFSDLSVELANELKEEVNKVDMDKKLVHELVSDITQNQEKITYHGKRASSIVKAMLEHSRTSTGIKTPTDINKLADECLRLAYHGLRAKDQANSSVRFNSDFKTDFDPDLPLFNVIPQDFGRVLLNLVSNAFYAVGKRTNDENGKNSDYKPLVILSTQSVENQLIIKIKDNGVGISESTKAKIFQPFFTTKPTGEGTGLGLSLAYDIITKGHNGTIECESKEGEGTTFTIKI